MRKGVGRRRIGDVGVAEHRSIHEQRRAGLGRHDGVGAVYASPVVLLGGSVFMCSQSRCAATMCNLCPLAVDSMSERIMTIYPPSTWTCTTVLSHRLAHGA